MTLLVLRFIYLRSSPTRGAREGLRAWPSLRLLSPSERVLSWEVREVEAGEAKCWPTHAADA